MQVILRLITSSGQILTFLCNWSSKTFSRLSHVQLSRCAASFDALRLLYRTLKTIQRRDDSYFFRTFVLCACALLLSQASVCDRPRFEASSFDFGLLPRKEVIQPHLPIRLPCYDFTPVIDLTLGSWLLPVTSLLSGAINSHGVTGGVYKARERIHRGMLIRDY